jgi:hypothetical protein
MTSSGAAFRPPASEAIDTSHRPSVPLLKPMVAALPHRSLRGRRDPTDRVSSSPLFALPPFTLPIGTPMIDTPSRTIPSHLQIDTQRYIDTLAGADPIDTQRKAPKRLKKLLKGLSEKQLSKRTIPGKWSIKEVVAHLADGEVIMGARLRFIAAQDRPPIPGYDQDLFVQNLGIEKVRTKDLLEAFAMARKLNVQLLERLEESALDRVGLHSERGEESIRTMVTMYAGHDMIHEEQIRAAREALKSKKTARKAEVVSGSRNGERTKAERRSEKKAARKAGRKLEKMGAT